MFDHYLIQNIFENIIYVVIVCFIIKESLAQLIILHI
jgi:hypothetical protein